MSASPFTFTPQRHDHFSALAAETPCLRCDSLHPPAALQRLPQCCAAWHPASQAVRLCQPHEISSAADDLRRASPQSARWKTAQAHCCVFMMTLEIPLLLPPLAQAPSRAGRDAVSQVAAAFSAPAGVRRTAQRHRPRRPVLAGTLRLASRCVSLRAGAPKRCLAASMAASAFSRASARIGSGSFASACSKYFARLQRQASICA